MPFRNRAKSGSEPHEKELSTVTIVIKADFAVLMPLYENPFLNRNVRKMSNLIEKNLDFIEKKRWLLIEKVVLKIEKSSKK